MRQGSLCVPGEMHMHIFLSKNKRNWIWGVIAVAAVVRLITLGSYPLTDNTEARYAEVAREMVSTGNWVSPQLHGQKILGETAPFHLGNGARFKSFRRK